MADLRSQDNGQLSQRLRTDPLRHLRALEAACHDIANDERPGYDKEGAYVLLTSFLNAMPCRCPPCHCGVVDKCKLTMFSA